MRLSILLAAALLAGLSLHAQTIVPIPPLLSGTSFELTVQPGTHEFFPGIATNTIGYNGSHLGPTLELQAGQEVAMNVHNTLGVTTTVHWHGLHVAPADDGSPHTPILPGATWSPAFPVLNQAGTYWYHPHAHGMTMQQALLGAAGFIIVRDAEEAALELPRTYGVDDVPLVFQFKTFDAQKQIVLDDEADNTVLVNGVRNGVLTSPAQIVRYRLLNGSSHRYFRFGFADNRVLHAVAGDAGLLDAPVALTRLELAPGERMEILVDLGALEGQTLTLNSYGSQLPTGYPGGAMMMMGGGTTGPLDDTDFTVLTIAVGPPTADAVIAIPAALKTNTPYATTGATTRSFNFSAQPMMSMTNFFINGQQFEPEIINFTTEQDRTEVWTVTNQTMMAHPLHIHGNPFYVLSIDGAAPPLHARGPKDVVTVPPMGGQVKLVTRYADFGDPELPYLYHCHIFSHEDGGMMGQFIVQPAPAAVHEPDQASVLLAMPNPVIEGQRLQLRLNLPAAGNVRIRLTDGLGRVAHSAALGRLPAGEQVVWLNLGSMPAGLYVVESRSDGKLIGRTQLAVR
jgi:blue copper oxidase